VHFAQIIDENPYREAILTPKFLHVMFLKTVCVDPDHGKVASFKKPSEAYFITEKAVYLHAPEGIGSSKVATQIEKVLKVQMTGRNWNTVTKLYEMVPNPMDPVECCVEASRTFVPRSALKRHQEKALKSGDLV